MSITTLEGLSASEILIGTDASTTLESGNIKMTTSAPCRVGGVIGGLGTRGGHWARAVSDTSEPDVITCATRRWDIG